MALLHPTLDVAVLRVDAPTTLTLSSRPPKVGDEIVVVGHPSVAARDEDEALSAAFGQGLDGRMHLMPGACMSAEVRSILGQPMRVVRHDATTAGGCSGGPVVALDTGEILGIHIGGDPGGGPGSSDAENRFHAAADLLADPHLRAIGVGGPPRGERPASAPIPGWT